MFSIFSLITQCTIDPRAPCALGIDPTGGFLEPCLCVNGASVPLCGQTSAGPTLLGSSCFLSTGVESLIITRVSS